MTVKVHELKGITTELANALKTVGIDDSAKLLAAAGQAADRKALATKHGVEARQLLELANRADLARINGIGAVYADLLEHAGVDTVVELRTRNADNLYEIGSNRPSSWTELCITKSSGCNPVDIQMRMTFKNLFRPLSGVVPSICDIDLPL